MSLISLPSLTLVVKAPNQKIADQTIKCTGDWTVRKLKEYISRVYPTNPVESQQRIIYSGKLLRDESTLKDVLKQYEPNQTIHTVHLVCSASMNDSTVQGSAPTSADTAAQNVWTVDEGIRRRHNVTEYSFPSSQFYPNSEALLHGVYPPAVDYRHYMPHPSMMHYNDGQLMMSGYSAEQVAWMQQVYAQSVMNYQYMQQFQHSTSFNPIPPPATVGHAHDVPATPVTHNAPPNQNLVNLPAVQQEPPLPLRQQQQVRLNAQGGRVLDDDEDGDEMNRDWLDNAYTALRLMMLLSILYFYSSLHRFLATLGLMVIVYLYHCGWLHRRRNRRANVDGGRQMEAPAPPADNHNEEVEEATPNSTPENVETTTRPQPQPSAFSVFWSVFVSFFASLVPENPPPINAN